MMQLDTKLVKILVQYGEQCHLDGYIDEESINQTIELLQACIQEAIIDELENTMPYTDGMRHYNTVKKRIAELKSQKEKYDKNAIPR